MLRELNTVTQNDRPHKWSQVRMPVQLFKIISGFITTIPRTYTSLLLDGVARNYLLSAWICKIMQFFMSGSIFLSSLYPRKEEKPFGLSWNRIPVLLLRKLLI